MPARTARSHNTQRDTPVLFLGGAAQHQRWFYLGLRTSSDSELVVTSEGQGVTTKVDGTEEKSKDGPWFK